MQEIEKIFSTCFELKKSESVLIIIDPNYIQLGQKFLTIANKISEKVNMSLRGSN